MRMDDWKGFYTDICRELSLDPDSDAESAAILSGILGERSRLEILERFRGKPFYVVGNGPNLLESIERIGEGVTIVADSALLTYLERRPVPDIVVTDLDGDLDALHEAYDGGSLMVLHAHGDNIPMIRKYAGDFAERAIGTTQSDPLDNIFNFGGFTDGDRGAFLADYLDAERIYLVGFDFETVGHKPGTDSERKRIKLRWAKVLLQRLAEERGTSLEDGAIIPL